MSFPVTLRVLPGSMVMTVTFFSCTWSPSTQSMVMSCFSTLAELKE